MGTVEENAPTGLPEGFRVYEDGMSTVIERKWHFPHAPAVLLFITLLTASGIYGALTETSGEIYLGLSFLLWVFVGYSMLAHVFNSTWVRVSSIEVSVKHGPLPWRGGQTVQSPRIERLYCVRETRRSTSKRGTKYHDVFHVFYVEAGTGRHLRLVGDLLQESFAQCVRREVARVLGVRNEPGLTATNWEKPLPS